MAHPNPNLKALMEQALSALPQELGCDSCSDYLAAYAQFHLGGVRPPDSLKGVGEHLERCNVCLEEFKLLIEAVQGADDHLSN